jgi:hypothetical protein
MGAEEGLHTISPAECGAESLADATTEARLSVIGTWRELAHRHTAGIDVTMMWDSASDQVTVAVNDTKAGKAFELIVGADERAMDVYTHPFAYAAARKEPNNPPALGEAA